METKTDWKRLSKSISFTELRSTEFKKQNFNEIISNST